jgi:hypothetical protein
MVLVPDFTFRESRNVSRTIIGLRTERQRPASTSHVVEHGLSFSKSVFREFLGSEKLDP